MCVSSRRFNNPSAKTASFDTDCNRFRGILLTILSLTGTAPHHNNVTNLSFIPQITIFSMQYLGYFLLSPDNPRQHSAGQASGVRTRCSVARADAWPQARQRRHAGRKRSGGIGYGEKSLVKWKIGYTFVLGKMAERSIAAVLKTVEPRGSGGSNPSLSAN